MTHRIPPDDRKEINMIEQRLTCGTVSLVQYPGKITPMDVRWLIDYARHCNSYAEKCAKFCGDEHARLRDKLVRQQEIHKLASSEQEKENGELWSEEYDRAEAWKQSCEDMLDTIHTMWDNDLIDHFEDCASWPDESDYQDHVDHEVCDCGSVALVNGDACNKARALEEK